MKNENKTLTFVEELRSLINRHSLDTKLNTPDYVLAGYLECCLNSGGFLLVERDAWWGFEPEIGGKSKINLTPQTK
jgi:hypothetical protein